MPFSTFLDRINGYIVFNKYRLVVYKLTELEEEVVVQYILELDIRGFGPRLASIEEIANNILKSRDLEYISKN